ncbi:MAG: autotransporter domain-containing protein [Pseudomonadota bacterium]|nr:autotransporter domain-containing protein [Pseudomonadota bacterium]
MKLVRTVLAAALALAAAPALAQSHDRPYTQTVFFGDSLTDAGFYKPFLIGVSGPAAGFVGRFTTNPGLVWAEYLAGYYGTSGAPAWTLTTTGIVPADGSNYAAGGARITLQPGFPPSPPTSFAPSLSMQIKAHLAANGGAADPRALYTVWGGANDLFFHLNGLTTQAQFFATAGQQVGLVSSLHNAGARYILLATMPDVGVTPFGLSQGPAGAAGISALVGGYNQTVFGGIAQAGLRVIPLNTFGLLREVSANPLSFGFSNVTGTACGAVASLTCSAGNLVAPGADLGYVYADGVHPTTGGHLLLADYAVAVLEGPRQIAVMPNVVSMVGRARAEWVTAQLAVKPEADGMRWWVDGRGDFQRYGHREHYKGAGPALTVGVDLASGNFVFGAFGGVGQQNIDWGRGGGSYDQDDRSIGGYAGWSAGAAWVNAQVSYTDLEFDIERRVKLGALDRVHRGAANGDNLSVGVNGGWEFGQGALRHGPVIGVLMQDIDIDGFAESEPTLSTSLSHLRQQYESLIGSAGWQVSYAAAHLTPYARLTLDREFEDTPDEAFAQLQSMPNTAPYAVPGASFDHQYTTLLLGARTKAFGLDANFGTHFTIGQRSGQHGTLFASVGGRF